MADIATLQKFAENHSANWWKKAQGIYGSKIGKLPITKMNRRLTSTGGRAFYTLDYTDYSVYLMERNPAEYANVIIPHELAHHICWRLYKNAGHCPEWKNILSSLTGKPAARCHAMKTKSQIEKGL